MIIDTDFMSEDNKTFIRDYVLKGQIPFFLASSTVGTDKNYFLSHSILKRPEERTEGETFTSVFSEQFMDIFYKFIHKNNILATEIMRCCINLTFSVENNQCPIHVDHPFPHKQLIVYLNDCLDKDAHTVVLKEDEKTILHSIEPEQFKGVCFDSSPHYGIFPKKGIRLIVVYTFKT